MNLDFGNKFVPAYSSVTGARESKFIEFYGTLKGKFQNSINFNFNCLKNISSPFLIQLVTEKNTYCIYEELGKLITISFNENKMPIITESSFSFPYQSGLTNLVVEKLLCEGKCELTPFNDSSLLHKVILKSFLKEISVIENTEIKTCPIT